MVAEDCNQIEQVVEMQKVELKLVEDGKEDAEEHAIVEQEQEQDHDHDQEEGVVERWVHLVDDNHYLDHVNKEVEVQEEQSTAEQDVQEDSDIEGGAVQIQIHEAVQSDNGWGCSEFVDHIQPVVPEPDVIWRYLEGLDP